MKGVSPAYRPGAATAVQDEPGSLTTRLVSEHRKTEPSRPAGRGSKAVRSTITAPGKKPAATSHARRRRTSSSGSSRFFV